MSSRQARGILVVIELLKWPEGKIPFLIRDDDISFFTRNDMLKELYKFAWQRSFIPSFSIIPCISASSAPSPKSNAFPQLSRLKFDPCIPPSARGDTKKYEINSNPELVSFLLKLREKGMCDLMLHGLSHERTEFLSEDKTFVQKVFDECFNRFAATFHFPPRVFVFPYDKGSHVASQLIASKGLSVCNAAPLINRVLNKFWVHKASFRFSNDAIDFFCGNSQLSPLLGFRNEHTSIELAKREFLLHYKNNDIFCLSHHHWEFFFDWEKHVTQQKALRALNVFLDYVDKFDIWKCGFSEVSEWLITLNGISIRRLAKNRIILKNKYPLKILSFRCNGRLVLKGLSKESTQTQDDVWTVKNVPKNSRFEVLSKK
jgi:hypothetical protein